MSNWRNDFIPKNKYTRPGILLKGVKKIVLHWTANPGASADAHKRYFGGTAIQNKTYASAHIFVDPKEAICIIPLNEMAYHANDEYEKGFRGVKEIAPNANRCTIGVEMCVDKDGTISPDTIKNTIEVIVDLCKTYKLTENDIVRHYDVTHKPCPKPFIDDPTKFEDFKKQVGLILNPPVKEEVKPVVTKPEVKPVTPKPTPKPPVYPGDILNVGSRGNSVKLVQAKLGLKADGIFGPLTEKAVKNFQKKNGLLVDGKVGPKTWSKLFV
jgi:N-acetylmuramoyl-L-alanine amidase